MQIAKQERTVLTNLLPEDQSEFELPIDGRAKQIIQDILIAKQYSNPLKAACREALQNALDANKEAGNDHLPITITLPTDEEPQLIFEDCGVGIGAERFEKVYKKWGESTKREDNIQMGGYGVGRFSALAISSQVGITSVCDGIKYNHVLFYNERGCPAAGTLDTQPTNEPNGTKLIIPIKEHDINRIHSYIRELTQWVQQPIVFKQGYGNFQDTKSWNLTGVLERAEGNLPWYFNNKGNDALQVTVLIGQLPYVLQEYMVKGLITNFSFDTLRSSYSSYSSLVIRLPVGSVELTSNRENISDSNNNLAKLRALVYPVIADVESQLSQLVNRPCLRDCLKSFFTEYPFSVFTRQGITFESRSIRPTTNIQLTTDRFDSCSLIWGHSDSIKSNIIKNLGRNLSNGQYPIIFGKNHSLEHFLDCVWVVYPKGMSKDKIRNLANVANCYHILAIRTELDPDEYVKSHRLLKLMDDVITVNFKSKKQPNSTPKKAALKSLVKSGGARTLKQTSVTVSNIYDSTEKIEQLPECGVYIASDLAKTTFQPRHIPPSLPREGLFFVSNSIAERLKEEANWVTFQDYCTQEFDRLTTYYRLGLELIDYTIDQKWFSEEFLFGNKRGSLALADILLSSSIKGDDIYNLVELLSSPEEANWLVCISCSQFLVQKELEDSTQDEREKKRVRLQNLSWVLQGKTIEGGGKTNYFPGYEWTKIPIFKRLVAKYPMLTYLLRYYDFKMPWSTYTLHQEQLDLIPQIIKYMKDCDEISNK